MPGATPINVPFFGTRSGTIHTLVPHRSGSLLPYFSLREGAKPLDAGTASDPAGTIIAPAPGYAWPYPARTIGSFALTYTAGWIVRPESIPGANDAVNAVPASVQLMVEKAIEFRAGSGFAGFTTGSLKVNVADSYATDQLPREIASIGRAYQYRPGLFAARP